MTDELELFLDQQAKSLFDEKPADPRRALNLDHAEFEEAVRPGERELKTAENFRQKEEARQQSESS